VDATVSVGPTGAVTRAGRGQSVRGQHRRTTLLEAAADLLLEQGVSAVTHRAVAARAALPLASTTYYFTSLQDLRDQALRRLADRWLQRSRAALAALPQRLDSAKDVARALVRVVTGADPTADTPPHHLFVMYERYLEAGRHPPLRPLVVAYNDELATLAQEVLQRGGLPSSQQNARLALAVVDGALITALAEGQQPTPTAAKALATLIAGAGWVAVRGA
jgi:DNA-binding transcriptional regulator YbjK